MGLFDKVTKTTANIGRSVVSSAAGVGSAAKVAVQEQQELVSLRSQLNVIQKELDASYVQIGRKYVEYVLESGEMPGIDVSDLLKLMDPQLSRQQELEKEIIRVEKEIKEKTAIRDKKQAEEDFLAEKKKLDKALAMEVLTQEEYDVRLAIAKKKVEHFEEIRRIEQQADMGLISKEEKLERINALLN